MTTTPAGEPEKDGLRTTGKPKEKCPCKVGKYKDLKNICAQLCEDGQAHHIVPDFTKRYVARKDGMGEAGRIKGLASYNDGASICLQGKQRTTVPSTSKPMWRIRTSRILVMTIRTRCSCLRGRRVLSKSVTNQQDNLLEREKIARQKSMQLFQPSLLM